MLQNLRRKEAQSLSGPKNIMAQLSWKSRTPGMEFLKKNNKGFSVPIIDKQESVNISADWALV